MMDTSRRISFGEGNLEEEEGVSGVKENLFASYNSLPSQEGGR